MPNRKAEPKSSAAAVTRTTMTDAVKPRRSSAAKKSADSISNLNIEMPEGRQDELSPHTLLLDPQNLRLLERLGSTYQSLDVKLFGQASVQKTIYDTIASDARFDIEALADSIELSGFLKHERLIVVPYDGDKFLVLEGNRRLTAVRYLFEKYGLGLEGLSNPVRASLTTLPCLVLEGPPIDGRATQAEIYRRSAEVYIGMRHLMGAKSWEPASRYEFQARLITEEGWTVNDVAKRFARKKTEVIRDFQAHLLYQGFVQFEKRVGISHSLTYNSFAEAARAPAILRWLGWDSRQQAFLNDQNVQTFFKYLVSRLSRVSIEIEPGLYDTSELPEVSSEQAVRKLNNVLKLGDSEVDAAINEGDFNTAEILFEERKEGELPKKISNFTKVLRRTSGEDLTSSSEIPVLLQDLQKVIEKTLKVIAALKD
jgi:hypothetical protein